MPQTFYQGKTGSVSLQGFNNCWAIRNWRYTYTIEEFNVSNTNSLFDFNNVNSYSISQYIPVLETSTISFEGTVDFQFYADQLEPGTPLKITLMLNATDGFDDIPCIIQTIDYNDDVAGTPTVQVTALVSSQPTEALPLAP